MTYSYSTEHYLNKAAGGVKWFLAAITILLLFVILVTAGGKWLYRTLWPNDKDVTSLVEQLQSDIEEINKNPHWQVQEADVEVTFTAKESQIVNGKTKLVSAKGEVGTEHGNKLILRLRRSEAKVPAPADSASANKATTKPKK